MATEKVKKEIDKICDLLNLPVVAKEEALKIYEEVEEKGLFRGRTTEGVIATVIYITIRKLNIPRNLDEIEKASGVDQKVIISYFRDFFKKLNIKLPPVDVKDFVVRIGHEINASEETIKKAVEIVENAKEKGIILGRDPNGVASASLYLASIITGEKIDYDKLLTVAGITAMTLRSRFKELIKTLKIEVPPQYL